MEVTGRKVLAGASALLLARMVIRFMQYLRWRREMCLRFPGFQPNLLLGDLPQLIKIGGYNEEFFNALHERFGSFARLFLSPTMLNVSTTDPELNLEAHKKMASRPHETYMFLSYLGDDNLMFQHGPIVKKMRLRYGMMISSRNQLEKVNDASYAVFSDLVDSWRDANDAGGRDAHPDMGPAIYDVMGRAFFGTAWTDHGAGKKIFQLHLHLIHNTAAYMFWPFKPWFLPGYRKYASVLQEWRDTCWGLIQEHRAKMEADPQRYENDESALTLLCSSKDDDGEPFFFKGRAISTMCGFLNGAYDTTHCTMYWIIYHLARFPEDQERLRLQIQEHLGAGRRECTVDEARQIPLLDCFFRESLRYCSTVTVNQRVDYEKDVQIGDWVVPKGVNVNFPLSRTMRDRKHFGPDADTFRPERFLPEDPYYESAKRAWVAFGSHARMCVGYTFAQVELKAFLITLLQSVRVRFAEGNRPFSELEVRMFEAGVNQPKTKARFCFEALQHQGLGQQQQKQQTQQQEASLAGWWTPPKDKASAKT